MITTDLCGAHASQPRRVAAKPAAQGGISTLGARRRTGRFARVGGFARATALAPDFAPRSGLVP